MEDLFIVLKVTKLMERMKKHHVHYKGADLTLIFQGGGGCWLAPWGCRINMACPTKNKYWKLLHQKYYQCLKEDITVGYLSIAFADS